MTPQWLTELKEAVSQLENETVKFYEKGNKSAGTRTRKLLQILKQFVKPAELTFKKQRLTSLKLNLLIRSSH